RISGSALFDDARPLLVRLRDNAFLVMPAGYGVVLILWYAYYGVLFSFLLGAYFYGLHFPLVIGSAILLWYSNKTLYKRYVYSLVACSYVSLVFYTLAPSAPPWYNGVASNLLAPTSAQIGSSSLFSELARTGSLIDSDQLAAC